MKLKDRYNSSALKEFADELKEISEIIGFKVSARGWCYAMEQRRMINKNEFDKVADLINKCRRKGFLPIDFCAEDDSRMFKGVDIPSELTLQEDFMAWLKTSLNCADLYSIDWWEDEEYYIQMVVEKVDLVTLFRTVCERYHIPIANTKGWSSMLQRAQYARRFLEAEQRGLKCILLYCGDHDPDGLRISDFLRKNLEDVSKISWEDGEIGYDPSNLMIERFGLNKDFIDEHGLTWIDNLITGNKAKNMDLSDPSHRNHNMSYVQDYLGSIGARKCEANALITIPEEGMDLCEKAIRSWLGDDAISRFEKKRKDLVDKFEEFLEETGIDDRMNDIYEIIDNY